MPPNTTQTTDQFTQLLTSLEGANNVLVTVSASPSVDQLAAAIGLTLALNKKGKHATAVFSGKVPSTLEFLQPERTIEKNTDSLQDFIISLDKSKADKLRYKIEDDFVKIFITPYRSSVSEADLNFSQGDFNIDLVITIGVHEKAHLDGAIIAHGRILHDATVASITSDRTSELGSISWLDNETSSLCEMVTDLVNAFAKEVIDAQIATALLTGMVAETERFGNDKARPHTMSLSGILMAAGASTQLIQSKLQEPEPEPEKEPVPDPEEPSEEIPQVVEPEALPELEQDSTPEPATVPDDAGTFTIQHEDDNIHIDEEGRLRAKQELEEAQAALAKEQEEAAQKAAAPEPEPIPEPTPPSPPLQPVAEEPAAPTGRGLVLEPPQLGGQLTANSQTEADQQNIQPPVSNAPLLDRSLNEGSEVQSPQTLSDLERAVNSPHIEGGSPLVTTPPVMGETPPVDDARSAVDQVLAVSNDYRPEPISALNATTIELTASPDEKPAEEPPQNPDESSLPPPPPVPPPTYNV